MATDGKLSDIVQLIKDTADIVAVVGDVVQLRRSGTNFKGLCPFHSEKTPSFVVNPVRRCFHCFGCGEGGDVIAFLMKYNRLSFPESVRELAGRYHIPLPEKTIPQGAAKALADQREALYEINQKAASLFHHFLLKGNSSASARRYLASRGVDDAITESFQLGYAPDRWDFLANEFSKAKISLALACEAGLLVRKEKDRYYDRFRNRVMFPIIGHAGKVAGFGGRILGDGQPKYLNSPETPIFDKGRTLFGLHQAKDSIREAKACIVVEGNFDLISLVGRGIKNVVAPLGTALTQFHLRTLKGYADKIIILFDADLAGLKAAMRTVPLFLTEHLTAQVVVLPPGEDPDTFIRTQGASTLADLLKSALPLPEFVFDQLIARHGKTVEGKANILHELAPILHALTEHPMERSVLVSHFSERLGVDSGQVFAAAGKVSSGKEISNRGKTPPSVSIQEKRLLEFLVAAPEYVEPFIAAGLKENISSATGIDILRQLENQKAYDDGDDRDPASEEEIAGLATRRLISQWLTTAPSYDDKVKFSKAEEMLLWLKKNRLNRKKELLLPKIAEAHRANDEGLMQELIREKMAIDLELANEEEQGNA